MMEAAKTRVSIQLSLEQLADALRPLPMGDKLMLWRLLDADIDRAVIGQRFVEAVQAIRAAHPDVDEDEVMAEVLQATHEVRAAYHAAQNRS